MSGTRKLHSMSASEIETKRHGPLSAPRWDWYRCRTCGGFFVTVQTHRGEPMQQMDCRAFGDGVIPNQPAENGSVCRGVMVSAGHIKPNLWPSIVPRVPRGVWDRPDGVQRAIIRKKFASLEKHLRGGGLLLRPLHEGEHYEFPTGTDADGGGSPDNGETDDGQNAG